MTPSFSATIRGIRENPAVVEVNVRSGPNTSYVLIFKVPVGMANLPVLEVRADDRNTALQGKTYQWFRLRFPDGRDGWVRDDLIDVVGDGSAFGYPVVAQPVIGFSLTRSAVVSPAPAAPVPAPVSPAPAPVPAVPAPLPVAPITPAPAPVPAPIAAPLPGAIERVRKAAFNITAAFEGGGYATYQTYDSGIISYGRFQFTLASGSLMTVLNRYLERSSGPTADGLRGYLPRLNAKDESLRQDAALRGLFIAAASEAVMQQVQDEVATEGYWGGVMELSIAPRGVQSALGCALIFDMAIQHGKFNFILPKAEQELGVPPKSRLGQNGITEQTFITRVAQIRRDNLYALAEKLKLPGLRTRGDFWFNLVQAGDWNLQGDSNGNVNVNGKIVQVRNP
jgi:hypothetical protein